MIRWYDYLVAILAADFLITNVHIAFTADVLWINILGAVAAYFVWNLWNDTYCNYRLKAESQR